MSSHNAFDDGLHNDILNTGILEYHSVVIFDIQKSATYCYKNKTGFINSDCDTNKLLFINPLVHFAKFQKFFTKDEVNRIEQMIDDLN